MHALIAIAWIVFIVVIYDRLGITSKALELLLFYGPLVGIMVHRMKTKESKEGEPASTDESRIELDQNTETESGSTGAVALTLGACIVVAWTGELLGDALPGQQVVMMIAVIVSVFCAMGLIWRLLKSPLLWAVIGAALVGLVASWFVGKIGLTAFLLIILILHLTYTKEQDGTR